ncbi:MAG: hypothetical protein ACTSRP_09065 [Candidatus Helarchaeota archaeon]
MNDYLVLTIDSFILTFTIILTATIIAFIFLYTLKSKKAWSNLRESIIRIVVPFVISVCWIFYCQFHSYSFIIIISFLISLFLFFLLSQSDYFFVSEANLEPVGRVVLFFHKFNEMNDVFETKLYKNSNISITLDDVLNILKNEIDENISKTDITNLIKQFKDVKINQYFYYDFREPLWGFKTLITLSKENDIILGKMEGLLLTANRREYFGKKMQLQICICGQADYDTQRQIALNASQLCNIFANAVDVNIIPVLKAQIKEANRRTEEVLKAFQSEIVDSVLLREMLGEPADSKKQLRINDFLKYVIIISLISTLPIYILIILQIIGVV